MKERKKKLGKQGEKKIERPGEFRSPHTPFHLSDHHELNPRRRSMFQRLDRSKKKSQQMI
jgi:hypothetical protein